MSVPFVLILAGGSGERFWPLSRRNRPKQLLKLFSDRTLLEETVQRLGDITSPERILILTNAEQESAVRELLGDLLPKDNILAEPAKRDTAPAIALGVGLDRTARSGRHHDCAAGRSHHQGRGGLPGGFAHGLHRRAPGSLGARDDWREAHLGLPGVRLHRVRGGGARPDLSRAPVSRKARA